MRSRQSVDYEKGQFHVCNSIGKPSNGIDSIDNIDLLLFALPGASGASLCIHRLVSLSAAGEGLLGESEGAYSLCMGRRCFWTFMQM